MAVSGVLFVRTLIGDPLIHDAISKSVSDNCEN